MLETLIALIRNYKVVIYLFLGTILFSSGFYFGFLASEKHEAIALKNQEVKLVTSCNAAKKITEEVSNEYQKKLSVTNRKFSDYRKLYEHICVPITSATNGHNATAGGTIKTGTNGVPAITLLTYGKQCEQLHTQVIALQEFINRTWESK